MKEYTPEDFKYGYREISNGTFRLVDLIPAFEKELDNLVNKYHTDEGSHQINIFEF